MHDESLVTRQRPVRVEVSDGRVATDCVRRGLVEQRQLIGVALEAAEFNLPESLLSEVRKQQLPPKTPLRKAAAGWLAPMGSPYFPFVGPRALLTLSGTLTF